ncbi:hypothetical protein AMTR_s00110p00026910 [Amborella trichopoda]|uniref:Uncharacterized protein n=1 Tax=Amborella trichopoda TaxID=13333 RepID=W1NS70_AMBTC|nr:hypothetical protein AMTR_s00110p00026910 [Amborella trichopoda]
MPKEVNGESLSKTVFHKESGTTSTKLSDGVAANIAFRLQDGDVDARCKGKGPLLLSDSSKSYVGRDEREGYRFIGFPLSPSASLKYKGDYSSPLQSNVVLNGEASDALCIEESLTDVNDLPTVQIEGFEDDDCDGNVIITDNSLQEILEVPESNGNDEGGKFPEMPSSIDGERSSMQDGEDAGDMVSLQAKCLPQIPYRGESMDSVGAIIVDVVRNQQNGEGKESTVSAKFKPRMPLVDGTHKVEGHSKWVQDHTPKTSIDELVAAKESKDELVVIVNEPSILDGKLLDARVAL